MRHSRARQRSITRTVTALVQIVYHVFAPWHRKWRIRWGARADEPDPASLGEDLVPDPTWEFTHAVSIAAPVEQVWPWIAQIGQGRGGFYSFELLENIIGCHITNADRILPEFQDVAVGDEIRLHPTAPPLGVVAVEPGRSLVLRGASSEEDPGTTDSIWAFHVVPDGAAACRLIERGKSMYGFSMVERLFFSPFLMEPVAFVMSREMLLGIKERVEAAVGD
jgi:hypothetical protein